MARRSGNRFFDNAMLNEKKHTKGHRIRIMSSGFGVN